MNSIKIFSVLPISTLIGSLRAPLSALVDDSRKVQPDCCYVALRGARADGHDWIEEAVRKGARAIVAERSCPEWAREQGVVWVQVPDTHEAVGYLMSAWYGFPSQDLVTLAVTGTNGKTTTSYLAHAIFCRTWLRCGLVGTIHYDNGRERIPAVNTTPGAAPLQEMLARMLENGCRAVAMEVSSHSLMQKRVAGMNFRVGIFTNLTQDHLDFHGDMESYYEAKKSLFLQMAASGDKKAVAVINIDDPYGRRLVGELSGKMKVRSYGTLEGADFRMKPLRLSLTGSEYELAYNGKTYLVSIPLIGRFNMMNSLAALAGTVSAGIGIRDAIASLAQAPQVPGRLELVANVDHVMSFVDYAHTPDAIVNVCKTMKELCRGRLITVFGCGGDRDKAKRPLMGEAAARLSDYCIVTSDNPRSEDPEEIIADVLPGIPDGKRHAVVDRAEAIREALAMAKPRDIVLVAGKGHENYQEFATGRIAFSDVAEIKRCVRELEQSSLKERALERERSEQEKQKKGKPRR